MRSDLTALLIGGKKFSQLRVYGGYFFRRLQTVKTAFAKLSGKPGS